MPTKKNVIDLSAVESGGGGFHVPEGDYRFRIKGVKYATSQSGNPMFVWELQGLTGRAKGKTFTERTSLQVPSLWKLKNLVLAVTGDKLPPATDDMRVLLKWLKKLVGKELYITMVDEPYTNDKGEERVSSKSTEYISVDDFDADGPDDDEDEDDEDDDDEDEDDDDEEEDDDENEDDGLDELDRAALKKHIKAHDLDIKVKTSMSDDDIREAIREEDDDEDVEELDLDEV